MQGTPVIAPPLVAGTSLILSLSLLSPITATADPGKEEAVGGRFLYAPDDDWDWASRLGAEEVSKLAKYGSMPWSALDWAEEGLDDVRGVLVGTPPNIGGYQPIEGLSKLRGGDGRYERAEQKEGVVAELLAGDSPPNVVILMQDAGRDGILEQVDIESLTEFVKLGGRLVVLDDWQRYPALLESVLEAALAIPAAPPGPESDDEEGAVPPGFDPADPELKRHVAKLVRNLSAADFATREGAMIELWALGAVAVELAASMKSDDPEVAARIGRLRAELAPKPHGVRPGQGGDGERRMKHQKGAERVSAAAAKLKRAGFRHSVKDVFVDKEGAPLPALRMSFPVR